MALRITGALGSVAVLQVSTDFNTWADLQSLTLSASPTLYIDAQANGSKLRWYRVKNGSAPAPSLPDLSTFPNSVFTTGQGTDSLQYAPNGTLGLIFWQDRTLNIRERTSAQTWSEQAVDFNGNLFQLNGSRTDYNFQSPALLLYDSASSPHIFQGTGSTIAHYVRNGKIWVQKELIPNTQAMAAPSQLVGARGPNDSFHLAAISSGDLPTLTHGVLKNGQWIWTKITVDFGQSQNRYLPPSYAPRWFGLAVDSKNAAHLVFKHKFSLSYHPEGYVRVYNELGYASNSSGQWIVQTIQKPADISGEAGNGASIAISPDDKPCIAAWYNERGEGGSSQWSRLHYLQQDANGTWNSSMVVSRPDGYTAGDGEKGTGFAPQLKFDALGRPHIAFTDHASEHFSTGQNEYAGQVRHAYWNGSQWVVQTVFRQSGPLQQQIVYPSFALNGTEMAFTALQRFTDWSKPASTYKFTFFTKPRP